MSYHYGPLTNIPDPRDTERINVMHWAFTWGRSVASGDEAPADNCGRRSLASMTSREIAHYNAGLTYSD